MQDYAEDDNLYVLDSVVAEKTEEGRMLFLCKWQSYPWSECTWEPKEHLQVGPTDFYEQWKTKKRTFPKAGSNSLNAWMRDNVAKYERNREKALLGEAESDEDTAPVIDPNEDSGETASLKDGMEKSRSTATPVATSKSSSRGTSSLSPKARRKPHRPALEQSESSGSDATDDSLMAELQSKHRHHEEPSGSDASDDSLMAELQSKHRHRQALERRLKNRRRGVGSSESSSENDSSSENESRTAITTKPAPVRSKRTNISTLPGVESTSKLTKVANSTKKTKQSVSMKDIGKAAIPGTSRSGTAATVRQVPTANLADTNQPRIPTASSAPAKVAIRTGAPGRIRIVNAPKLVKRKEWSNSERHYKTLKMRNNAEKRGKRELIPDINALQFVNAPLPNAANSASQAPVRRDSRPNDNPYGIREPPRRRTNEEAHEHQIPAETTAQDESNKVPLTCWEWRNGSCQLGDRCRFLHRVTEPLKFSPRDGTVPPKYRNPPITCKHWFENLKGCVNSDDDCSFAHRNTGWLGRIDGKLPDKIDPKELPASRRGPPKFWERPLTCFFYMESRCNKTDERCVFAHYNTGRLMTPDNNIIEIDPTLRPKNERRHDGQVPTSVRRDETSKVNQSESDAARPDSGSPLYSGSTNKLPSGPRNWETQWHPGALTCYYWANGGCLKTEAACRFQHRMTAQVAEPPEIFRKKKSSTSSYSPIHASLGRVGPNPFPNSAPVDTGVEDMPSPMDTGRLANETEDITIASTSHIRPSLPTPSFQSDGASRALEAKSSVPRTNSKHANTALAPPSSVPSQPSLSSLTVLPLAPTKPIAPSVPLASPSREITTVNVAPPLTQNLCPENIANRRRSVQNHGCDSSTFQRAPILEPRKSPCADLEAMIASAYQLDFATMFCGNDENVSLDRQAFILFHPDDHAEDLELIVRWLLIHHVEVYTLRVDGAWDHFKSRILKGETGVIIAHPTFKRFWCIPDFGKVLLKNVRVWSVGFQRAVDSEPQYGCIEMFPHGGMIYITDDVFEKEPLKALEMIALFIRKIDQCKSVPGPANPEHFVNDRCLLWRLAVRPELMRALWDWCDAHGEEIDAGEPAAQARAQLYMLLSESHYIEQDVPGEWVLQPDDFWPIISERQEVSEVYFQALRHGQKYANETQVELFAGTVIDYRRDYRHFSIVHTEPAKVDWQSRWHNIDEVMTPDEYIAYMRQGNRFEFYIPEDTESAESEKDILPMSSSAPMDISSPETV